MRGANSQTGSTEEKRMMGYTLKGEVRSIKVEMPYIGNVISCNHYLGRRRDGGTYVKAEALAWMEQLGWLIVTAHIEDWRLPLTVRCDGRFKDKRNQPDLSNLSKVIMDSIEEASGVNDKNFRWQDGDVSYGLPTLWITITEAE